MSAPLVEPSACTWCGTAQRGHAQQYAPAVGWHKWAAPSQEQILARMKARRLALTVAREGALPVPVGPEPRTLDVVEDELTGARLSLYEEELETARLRLALKSAQRGRLQARETVRQMVEALNCYDCPPPGEAPLDTATRWRGYVDAAEARVAELEAEQRITNEALDGAARALRAKQSAEPGSSGRCGKSLSTGEPCPDHPVSYPPALPWAALMDDEDRTEFLDELADSATTHARSDVRLAEVEKTCGTWRLIGEAQHGHNTAPGPDAVGPDSPEMRSLREALTGSPAASLREPEGEHYEHVHHSYRVPHDLPETGGDGRG